MIVDDFEEQVNDKIININSAEEATNSNKENNIVIDEDKYKAMSKDIDRIIDDNVIAEECEEDGEQGAPNNNNLAKEDKGTESHKKERQGLTRLPLSKIKNLMKLDKDIKLCQQNSYIVVAKLTELFLQELAQNAHSVAKINKRKTMNLEDIACAVKSVEKYNFIDINTIFNVETVEDLKAKEEKFEKRARQAELKNQTKEKNDKKEDKAKVKTANKKNGNSATTNNMRIDQMFFGNNN